MHTGRNVSISYNEFFSANLKNSNSDSDLLLFFL